MSAIFCVAMVLLAAYAAHLYDNKFRAERQKTLSIRARQCTNNPKVQESFQEFFKCRGIKEVDSSYYISEALPKKGIDQ